MNGAALQQPLAVPGLPPGDWPYSPPVDHMAREEGPSLCAASPVVLATPYLAPSPYAARALPLPPGEGRGEGKSKTKRSTDARRADILTSALGPVTERIPSPETTSMVARTLPLPPGEGRGEGCIGTSSLLGAWARFLALPGRFHRRIFSRCVRHLEGGSTP